MLGRGAGDAGDAGGFNCDVAGGDFFVEGDREGAGDERDEGDVDDVEVEMLRAGGSASKERVPRRGLGTCDGFALVTRLCAYELKASGVENGG